MTDLQSEIELPEVEPPDTAPSASVPRKRGRPRKTAATSGPTKPPNDKAPRQPRRATTAQLQKRLETSLTTLGTGIALMHPGDGILVVQHAEAVSQALARAAEESPQVRAALERMLTAGVWSGVIAAVMPLAIGIAANHGLVPSHLAAFLAPSSQTPEASAQSVPDAPTGGFAYGG